MARTLLQEMATTKGTTALKKIIADAKTIQKAHPNKKWTTCVSEAGAKYRKAHPKPKAKK